MSRLRKPVDFMTGDSRLKEAVRNSIKSKAMGLHMALNTLCIKEAEMDCIDLLAEDPLKLLELISRLYQSEHAVTYIFCELLLKPLLSAAGQSGREEELMNLLSSDPEKFKAVIRKLLCK